MKPIDRTLQRNHRRPVCRHLLGRLTDTTGHSLTSAQRAQSLHDVAPGAFTISDSFGGRRELMVLSKPSFLQPSTAGLHFFLPFHHSPNPPAWRDCIPSSGYGARSWGHKELDTGLLQRNKHGHCQLLLEGMSAICSLSPSRYTPRRTTWVKAFIFSPLRKCGHDFLCQFCFSAPEKATHCYQEAPLFQGSINNGIAQSCFCPHSTHHSGSSVNVQPIRFYLCLFWPHWEDQITQYLASSIRHFLFAVNKAKY